MLSIYKALEAVLPQTTTITALDFIKLESSPSLIIIVTILHLDKRLCLIFYSSIEMEKRSENNHKGRD